MIQIIWFILLCIQLIIAKPFDEKLHLRPLPRNKLLSSFEFIIESLPFNLQYYNESISTNSQQINHYTYFPNTLGPIIENTNTRQLQLRFTQGWWDSKSWGKLPFNGKFSGGTGVEVVAIIEAPNVEIAQNNWSKLTKILSGFFCASFNFIDDDITTYPRYLTKENHTNYLPEKGNKLYLLRAALPSEPVCTENLTPFLKLLPTKGKAGISSLLDGHKVFDSLWHGMSIDITTECNNDTCQLKLHQTINQIVDIMRSIRKKEEGGIPKPTKGEKLRCDTNKTFNVWQCFPLGDPTEIEWSLETIYGRKIKGSPFEDDSEISKVSIDYEPSSWNVQMFRETDTSTISNTISNEHYHVDEYLTEQVDYNFKFSTDNSLNTLPIDTPPLYASRSLTGYSLDQGGLRVTFTNPLNTPVEFIYFESVPWFMRLYFHTLKLETKNETGKFIIENHSDYIKDRYYRPAVDRSRPSHMELYIEIPPNSSLSMSYEFDKSLLLYREYPPDANHGFDVEPAIITILDSNKSRCYEFRTTSLLLTLPTPDFSMPYNVIILTCTVLSLAFGTLFNLLTKKTVTDEEYEIEAQNTKFAKLKNKIKLIMQNIKSRK
ncbi:unnamed protein product [Candida verbasci]|uniref:GPI transamidase component GPI16 n=1 Tax=Candida verbasci TaxID=1227364 RepID=A0A9W4XHS3_9ASCO|nr:unnamed protein product [Candida verbasci]